jgi:hypothetical protein
MEYWAWENAGFGYWSWGSLAGREVHGGLDGAKAAAQADYESRIFSALSTPSAAPAATSPHFSNAMGCEPMEEIKRLEKLSNACYAASSLRQLVAEPELTHLIGELCEAGHILQSLADLMKENSNAQNDTES